MTARFTGSASSSAITANYQPGDDLRHLDWRLYARSDRLCIKRYMQETNARFYVVCDTSASMNYRGAAAWGSKLECAKVLAAALTWFLLKQNDAAGMVTLSGESEVPEFIRPSQRPNQFGLMLRQLELLQARQAARACRGCCSIPCGWCIAAASSCSSPTCWSRRKRWRWASSNCAFNGHEVIIFQVLDPDEMEFPFTEPRLFEDLETGVRRMVTPRAARENYLARFNAFMQAAPRSVPEPGDVALRGAHGREPLARAGALSGGAEAFQVVPGGTNHR